MNEAIVDESRPVTLIGCGTVKETVLRRAIVQAPAVVAADGAAQVALDHGIMPDAVIGDFDSIPEAARARIPPARLHRITEQDSTDFEKCLRNICAPLVIGVGFGGGRVDHQLAAFHGLMRHADRPCLLLGERDLVFLMPPALCLSLPQGSRFSLFPLGEVRARSLGLRWPLDDIGFAPGLRIGTSNAVSGPVEIEVSAPAMLAILPARALEAVIAGLTGAEAVRWPCVPSS